MIKEEYITLYGKYLDNACSKEELELLNSYEDEFALLLRPWEKAMGDKEQTGQEIYNSIHAEMWPEQRQQKVFALNKNKRLKWLRLSAAAVLIVVAGSIVLYLLNKPVEKLQPATTAEHFKNDVAPGSNKAILTIAGGREIILDSNAKGTLSKDGNTTVVNFNGLLSYTANMQLKAGTIAYNTVTTPRGGQYKVILPDGSKVWLDAASSIQFPIAFTGSKRTVTLHGEAYFEVTKNPMMPFTVHVNNMGVQVLGTHFNVMAYEDEKAIKTTLLEGAVKITHGTSVGFCFLDNRHKRIKPAS